MTVAIKQASELVSPDDRLVIEFNNRVTAAADNSKKEIVVEGDEFYFFIHNNEESICKAGYKLLFEVFLEPKVRRTVTVRW